MSKGAHRKDGPEETRRAQERGRVSRYNQNKRWSKAEEEELMRLRATGMYWRKIASFFHRTQIAVRQRYKLIRYRKNPGTTPTQAQEGDSHE